MKIQIKRITALFLIIFVMTTGVVFAEGESDAAATGAGAETVTQTEEGTSNSVQIQPNDSSSSDAKANTSSNMQSQTSKPAVVSHIVKKGKYYYYKDPRTGKTRKKTGFVTDNGSRYYVKKGGKIVTGKAFKVKKKTYRAAKNGKILTGVYKWGKKYYYANAQGQWIKKEQLVTWNGNKYYIHRKGYVLTNAGFGYNNVPYIADSQGRAKTLAIPDIGDNTVMKIARDELGTKTGRKYWTWYFKTRFRNTDSTPWCACFASWVYNKAGLYSKIKGASRFGNLGYVPSFSRFASSKGKWVNKKTAKAGDLIVFGKVGRHIGLVEGIEDGCIITIEGNTGPTAFTRGPGAVTRKAYKLTDKDIKGIIRP